MKKILISLLICLSLFFSNFYFVRADVTNNSELVTRIIELEKQISLLQQILSLTQQINELKMSKISEKVVEITDITPAIVIAGIEDNFKLEACEKRDNIYLETEQKYEKLLNSAEITIFDFSSLCQEKIMPCLIDKFHKIGEFCDSDKTLCKIKSTVFENTADILSGNIYNEWFIYNKKCKYGENWDSVNSAN